MIHFSIILLRVSTLKLSICSINRFYTWEALFCHHRYNTANGHVIKSYKPHKIKDYLGFQKSVQRGKKLFCFKKFLGGALVTTLSSTSKGKAEGSASPPSQAIPKTTSQTSYERNKVESGTRTKQRRRADPTQQKDKDWNIPILLQN